jgi:hypothetical protein
MSISENKLIHATMIPWVIALVAFVGLSALLPGHRANKREESSHDSGISATSDDVAMRGRSADPVVYLEPISDEEIKASKSFSVIPWIEVHSHLIATDCVAGAVQGRAPPVHEIL